MNNSSIDRRLNALNTRNRGGAVSFHFDGERFDGYVDEPLAAALYAGGLAFVSRSIKYYRPRGVFDLRSSCRSALVEVNGIPSINPSEVTCREGLKATGATHEVPLMVRLFSPMLNTSFPHSRLVRNPLLWPVVRHLVRVNANNPHPVIEPRNEVLGSAGPATTLDTDVVVIGAGIAGLEAAYKATRNNQKVIIIDDQSNAGGQLRYDSSTPIGFEDQGQQIARNLIERNEACRIQQLLRTAVVGFYEDSLIAFKNEEPMGGRIWTINAKAVVITTGRVDIPSIFENNDLPGIISSSMSLKLLNEYGIRPGAHGLIIGATDQGYRVASQLMRHGVKVAIADRKLRARAEYRSLIDVETVLGVERISARGNRSVEKVFLTKSGGTTELPVDFVASSSLQSSDIRLPAQAGVTIAYFEGLGYAPVHNLFMETNIPNVFVAGGVTGSQFEVLHLLEGRIAGLTASLALGSKDAEEERDDAVKEYKSKLGELDVQPPKDEMLRAFQSGARNESVVSECPTWYSDTLDGMQFVCFCEDVLVKDIAYMIQNIGFRKLEMIKRCTGVCMGHCQGRLCLVNAALIASVLQTCDPNIVGLTRLRPPSQPIPLRLLASM